jgi:hypothetical protein
VRQPVAGIITSSMCILKGRNPIALPCTMRTWIC